MSSSVRMIYERVVHPRRGTPHSSDKQGAPDACSSVGGSQGPCAGRKKAASKDGTLRDSIHVILLK